MKRGQSLEFFVEGGRSRSGKPYYPKAGLLSIVVDWVLASRNETDGILQLDALIVPVSISYEKIMDGNFTREQMVSMEAHISIHGFAHLVALL